MKKTQSNNCHTWMSQLDLYGAQPNLFIFGKQKYSSIVGVICTVIAIFFTIGYLLSSIQELVSKSLPNTVQSDHQVLETSAFPLNNSNFTFAVSVGDIKQNPLKTINQYFTITIENCLRTRHLNNETNKIEVNNSCTVYPTHACNQDDFITDLQKDYFNKLRLGTVQCIDKEVLRENPPILQGLVSGNIYAYITVKFSACKNTTQNNNSCASTEDINNGLLNGYYIVHISDSLIQLAKNGNIQDSIIKMQYTTFSISSSKTIFQGFRIIQSTTNTGLVLDDTSIDYFLVQQYNRESTTNYNKDYLVYHYIILDDKFTEFSRSYITLATILSRIGGLWQLIFLVLGFLNRSIIQNEMNINIANKLFRFDQNEDEEQYLQKCDSPINLVQSIKLNTDRLLKRQNFKIPNQLLKIFLFSMGCGKSIIQQIQQANKKIYQTLDIVEIISQLQQYEKLKEILLDKDQKILFELIPGPVISNKTTENNVLQLSKETSAIELSLTEGYSQLDKKFEQAYLSFNNLQSNNANQSGLNERIIQRLDPDMVKLFEQHNMNLHNREDEIIEQQDNSAKVNKSILSQLCDSHSDRQPSFYVSEESKAAKVKNTIINK